MSSFDSLVRDVLRGMGVKPNEPARWVDYIHKSIDQTTGEIVREMKSGYMCSKCGIRSWWKKSVCDGCHSEMPKE